MTVLIRQALLLCICLVTGINSAPALQQEELDNLRKQISVLQKELEKTTESQSEATDELRESERAISNSKRKLAELSLQHRAANHTLEKLRQQTQQLEREMQTQQTMLSKLLYQQYLGGKQEYFKLLLNNHDPDQTAREMRYYEYIARSRSTWLDMLRVNLAQLNEVAQLTQQKSGEIAALQAEENAQQKILEKDKLARQQVINQFAQQLKQQRHEIGRLQRDENRLSQLVAKLSKMLAQKKGKGVFNNDKLPDNRFDGKPFEQLKGKLTLPVMGQVVNKFGSARPDSTVLWRGLLLRAANGQPVKSVAAGRVVFADWLRGFGNLLIIDHGKGYMSLYGNNETLYKQVGDILRGGDTVAAVGNSGGNEDSGVYFELRYRGEPLDPIKWIAR
ncbi:MAG: Septal ring factor EnvC, activator of murein hydrolases AmiA and AmiB [Candidatus Nitrotoga sp. SPKER]|nr:MAG: Septal ring factor EnvC, activator of murein hydrolases AmiA and AmiB [Candidatus Nitrotoga sp. SPKER]